MKLFRVRIAYIAIGIIFLAGIGKLAWAASSEFLTALGNISLGTYVEDSLGVEEDVYLGGNLGVGTVTPDEKITVEGFIKTTEGIKFPDDTVQTSAPYWTKDNGNISFSDGNVGIGTANPSGALDIFSTSYPQLRLAYDANNHQKLQVFDDGGTTWSAMGTDADLNFDFSGATDGDFSVNSDDLFVDTSAGNVGIGSAAPRFKLDVAGTIGMPNNTAISMRNAANSADHNVLRLNNSDQLEIYNSNLVVNSSGNVGIGTTNPSEKLEVNGYMKVADGIKFSDGTIMRSVADAGGTGLDKASSAEIKAETDDAKFVTPLGVRNSKTLSVLCGEAINSATTPQAVHISDSTNSRTAGRVYKSDADDSTNAAGKFDGFVKGGNKSSGDAEELYMLDGDIVSGFTGLTIGADYFVSTSTSGAITTTNTGVKVGKAISVTQIMIEKKYTRTTFGTQNFNANGNITHGLGRKPNWVRFRSLVGGDVGLSYRMSTSIAEYKNGSYHGIFFGTGGTIYSQAWTQTSSIIKLIDPNGGSTIALATITITDTEIQVSFSTRTTMIPVEWECGYE